MGLKANTQKWVKWSEDKDKKFLRFLDAGDTYTLVPKLVGEALTWATIRLKEYRNIRVDRIKVKV